jgi:hypothetical protein
MTSLARLLRKHRAVALLVAILATETLVFAIVLFEMANRGTQSFPTFALDVIGLIRLRF